MSLTAFSRVHELVSALEFMDSVRIPDSSWSLVDYDETEAGDLKAVIDVDGQFLDVRVEPHSSVKTLRNSVLRKLRGQTARRGSIPRRVLASATA